MARSQQSEEMKFTNLVDKSLNSFTFKPNLFAYFLANRDIQVQQALFDCMRACVDVWATRFDNDEWHNDDELNLVTRAKRIQQAFYQF